ncbi:hypothetical protein [Agrococcus jejuensis]|uniref:hypothetical protein n=1 Tax=Agrococcus jejuensis TaxID=399736 RepID=UPI0011A0EB34|nr:hypothetical protein [Agrococcus jejuensis]
MTIQDVMRRVLAYGGLLALAIAVIGGIAGFVVAGWTGVVSALVGTAIAIAFLSLTAVSVIVGFKVSRGELLHAGFFGVLLGGMLLKFILFLVFMTWLQGQAWLAGGVVFGTMLAAVLGSLVVDVLVIGRSRQPTVDEPAEEETQGRPARR